jgi:four helix bundle protein
MRQKNNFYCLTKRWVIEVIKFSATFFHDIYSKIISSQTVRYAAYFETNYHAFHRVWPESDFIAKLECAKKKSDETLHWQEILYKMNVVSKTSIKNIYSLSKQILTMTKASLKTAKKNLQFMILHN